MSVFYKDGRAATLEVESLLGAGAFPFPKDSEVIADLVGMVTEPGDIVLDSFGGSGTTAHAVLRKNQHLKKPLNFILVEIDSNTAETKTRTRIKKAIEGYTPLVGKKKTPVPGLGGGFQYFRLSEEPLFQADGKIRSTVSYDQLAEFVWFMETGVGLAESALINAQHRTPYLGTHKGRAIFLLYNGILKDSSEDGGNVLNGRSLAYLNEVLSGFDGPKVVYGARTRFDKSKLAKLGITFHQLPYELAVKTWF